MEFFKYHGAGNDYVLLDAMQSEVNLPPELIRALCNRNLGVGADGVVVFSPPRAAGRLPHDLLQLRRQRGRLQRQRHPLPGHAPLRRGIHPGTEMSMETASGVKGVRLVVVEGRVREVQVEMGRPDFRRCSIPMLGEGEEAVEELTRGGRLHFRVTCLSFDNPHCVIFSDAPPGELVREVGPLVESHPAFPLGVNVEFAEVLNVSEMIQRTWERGAG